MYVAGARFTQRTALGFDTGYFGRIGSGEKGVVVANCVKTVIDHLRVPFLRDPGLGGPDTSGRRQNVVWPRVFRLTEILTANSMSETAFLAAMEKGAAFHVPGETPRTGRAQFGIDTTAIPADDDCLINEDAGYTGQGNFNYRVEIHTGGGVGQATFKWAREDVRARLVTTGGKRYLEGEPLDDHRAITSGDTVEVKGITNQARGVPAVLGTITIGLDKSVTFSAAINAALAGMTAPVTIIRWDHPHAGNEMGIAVTDEVIPLEKGIEITFSGAHIAGDYWHCAARIVTGDIIWPPREEDDDDGFVPSFNWGPQFAALAMFTRVGNGVTSIRDLRPKFPELSNLKAEDVRVDDTSTCQFAGDTVQDALEDLCARINPDICSITVRPDSLGEITQSLRPDIAALPTLKEALEKLGNLIEKIKVHIDKTPDPEPFARRVAIEFTAGEYNWPKDLKFALSNLSAVSLRACNAAPVLIKASNWLSFDRCLNVSLKGIQLRFDKPEFGLSVLGGKSVEMENVLMQRPHSTEISIARLGASRRITMRECRLLVDDVKGSEDLRPALHIATTDAQVLLENVMSNGALIVGAIVPKSADAPVRDLLAAAADGSIGSTFPRVAHHPREFPHQSSSGMRITGCKFRAIVPGDYTMTEIANWAKGNNSQNFSFSLRDASLSVSYARMMASSNQPLIKKLEQLARERVVPGTVAAPEFSLVAKSIPTKLKRPFRYIKLIDSEVILGPSILVAETVTVRGTRFSRFGNESCRAGEYLTASLESELFGSELGYLTHVREGESERPRKWRPVCFVVARRSSFAGNLGFPTDARGTKSEWPVMIDFSQPSPHLSRNLELLSLVPDALKDKLITLHQKYLNNPIK